MTKHSNRGHHDRATKPFHQVWCSMHKPVEEATDNQQPYMNSGVNNTMLPMTWPLSNSALAWAASRRGNFL